MTIDREQAEKLCTAPEYALFLASLPDQIAALTPKQLEAKIVRARNYRDKYQDLYQRQQLDTREKTGAKGGPAGNANARTELKVQLCAEMLERFEARLASLTREVAVEPAPNAPAPPAKLEGAATAEKPALKSKPAKKDKKAKSKLGFGSENSVLASLTRKSNQFGGKMLHGREAVSGKRKQVRRAKRG